MRARGLRSEVSRDLVHEVSLQDIARTSGGACARSDPTDLPGAGCGDRARSGVAGSYPPAVVGAAGSVASEDGAVHQGTVQPAAARGVSGAAKTLLGAAHVGAWVLLCDRWRGGRGNDKGLYRKPKVGRRRSGLQNHRAHGALSRLSAGHPSDASAVLPRLSVVADSTGRKPVVV